MSKLHKLTRKFEIGEILQRKVLGKQTYKELHPIGTQLEAAAKPAAAPAPLPDEEAIRRSQRKLLGARAGRTGRASTVLSDGDQLLG